MNWGFGVAILYGVIALAYVGLAIAGGSLFYLGIALVWGVCAGVWVGIGRSQNRIKASRARTKATYAKILDTYK